MLRPVMVCLGVALAGLTAAQPLVPDWQRRISTFVEGKSSGQAFVSDGLGGAYAVNLELPRSSIGNGFSTVVRRLDSVGNLLWTRDLHGIFLGTEGPVVDGQRNLILRSITRVGSTSVQLITSLTPTGGTRYQVPIRSRTGRTAFAAPIAADAQGQAFIASGHEMDGTTVGVSLTTLSNVGTVVSTYSYSEDNTDLRCFAIAPEPSGAVLMVIARPDGRQAAIHRVDPSRGVAVQVRAIGDWTQIHRLAVSASGRVFLSGAVGGVPRVTRYRGSDFVAERTSALGPANDQVSAMYVVPSTGMVFVATIGRAPRVTKIDLALPAFTFDVPGENFQNIAFVLSGDQVVFAGSSILWMQVSDWTRLGAPYKPRIGTKPAFARGITQRDFRTVMYLAAATDTNLEVQGLVRRPQPLVFRQPLEARRIASGGFADAATGALGVTFISGFRLTDRVIPFVTAYSATGRLLWQREYAFTDASGNPVSAGLSALRPIGNDVLAVAGTAANQSYVVRLRGKDGAVLWRRSLPAGYVLPSYQAFALDASTALISLRDAFTRYNMRTLRLNLSNGAVLWEHMFWTSTGESDPLAAIALPDGSSLIAASEHGGGGSTFSTWNLLLYSRTGQLVSVRSPDVFTGISRVRVAGMVRASNGQVVLLVRTVRENNFLGEWSLMWFDVARRQVVRRVPLGVYAGFEPGYLAIDNSGRVTVSVTGRDVGGTVPTFARVAQYNATTGARFFGVNVGQTGPRSIWEARGLVAGLNGTFTAQFVRYDDDAQSRTFGNSGVILRFGPTGRVTGTGVWGNRNLWQWFDPTALTGPPAGPFVAVAEAASFDMGLEVRLQRFRNP